MAVPEAVPGIIRNRIAEQTIVTIDKGVRPKHNAGKGNAHQQAQQKEQARRSKRAVGMFRFVHGIHAVQVVPML